VPIEAVAVDGAAPGCKEAAVFPAEGVAFKVVVEGASGAAG
jgi:hypothetical protein